MATSVIGQGDHRAQAGRFLTAAYDGVSTLPGKGVPHAEAVAEILRANGEDERTQLVGLLHDVVEDTRYGVEDVRAAFGDDIAEMVAALTEDPLITHYFPRKRALRNKVAAMGPPVVEVSLADKIASLHYAQSSGTPVTARKLAHYRATLDLATSDGVAHGLTRQLTDLLVGLA